MLYLSKLSRLCVLLTLELCEIGVDKLGIEPGLVRQMCKPLGQWEFKEIVKILCYLGSTCTCLVHWVHDNQHPDHLLYMTHRRSTVRHPLTPWEVTIEYFLSRHAVCYREIRRDLFAVSAVSLDERVMKQTIKCKIHLKW